MFAVIPTETGPVSKPRKMSSQPLHAVQIADALLKIQILVDLSGLGRTTIYSKIRSGELEVVRLGKRCTRVRGGEAQRFLQALGKVVAA
jgi:prophage regulatory protein